MTLPCFTMNRFLPRLAALAALLLTLCVACQSGPTARTNHVAASESDAPLVLTILHTSDEHGWLLPYKPKHRLGGVARLKHLWTLRHHWGTDPNLLVVSSGDNWTGPHISTWFKGKPVIEAMSDLGYAASTMGNHELDFGWEIFAQNSKEAPYPILAANIRPADGGQSIPGIQPSTLVERGGVKIGLIGLLTPDARTTANPKYTKRLLFKDLGQTLQSETMRLRERGAEVILVLAHECWGNMRPALDTLPEGTVQFVGLGHCHEEGIETYRDTILAMPGYGWRQYLELTLTLDRHTHAVLHEDAKLWPNQPMTEDEDGEDPVLLAKLKTWQEKADAQLGSALGFTQNGLARGWGMYNWINDSILNHFPEVDVVMTNPGAFRQPIAPGELTVGTLYSVLPFDNHLIKVTITGEQLLQNLYCTGEATTVAGIHKQEDAYRMKDGKPLLPDKPYVVMMNDFMYNGGDGYPFRDQDPQGMDTGVDWRMPVIEWMKKRHSSPEQPLETMIDHAPRL